MEPLKGPPQSRARRRCNFNGRQLRISVESFFLLPLNYAKSSTWAIRFLIQSPEVRVACSSTPELRAAYERIEELTTACRTCATISISRAMRAKPWPSTALANFSGPSRMCLRKGSHHDAASRDVLVCLLVRVLAAILARDRRRAARGSSRRATGREGWARGWPTRVADRAGLIPRISPLIVRD